MLVMAGQTYCGALAQGALKLDPSPAIQSSQPPAAAAQTATPGASPAAAAGDGQDSSAGASGGAIEQAYHQTSERSAGEASNAAGDTARETSAGPHLRQGPRELSLSTSGARLHGRVIQNASPFIPGVVETIQPGSKVDLTFTANLNSEFSQVGEEINARVSVTLKDGEKVLLPSGWYLRGLVTDIKGQRRLGRDGYVEVEFDKLVSPDGQWELPFAAKFSTADNKLKAVAKVVSYDTIHCAKGALVGSLVSVQMTGLPVAISTHGISVGVGAGVGAGLALIGALKRKGDIASLYPGDQKVLTISEPLKLPGFNLSALPSATPRHYLKDLQLKVRKSHFSSDPNGDSHSRLLTVSLSVDNQTENEYSFFDLAVVSDHDQRYFPYFAVGASVMQKKVPPKSSQEGTVTFSVDNPRQKYWLVLLDKRNREELSRVPVN